MRSFWFFARGMLQYRGTLLTAFVGAILAALCFGAGIMTVPFILNAMLGKQAKTLGDLLREADDKLLDFLPDIWATNAPTDPFAGVIAVLSVVFVLTIIGATGKFLHTYMAMSAGMKTVARVRELAFHRIIHMPLKLIVSEGSSDRISRVIRDSNQLRNGFTALTAKAVSEGLKATAALGVALWWDWKLTMLALLAAPLLAVTVRLFSKRVQRASKRALKQSGVMLGTITEAVQGLRVVKVHTAEQHEFDRFHKVNTNLLGEELSMRQAKALASPIAEALTVFGVIGIGALASWYIIHNDVEATTVLTTLLALGAAGAAVRPLTQLSTDVHESSAAAERLSELIGRPIEPLDTADLDVVTFGHFSRKPHEPKPVLAAHCNNITFDQITFRYPQTDHDALSDITLKIHHGETVAFVGPNGSGKTTLLSLIPRLFDPDSGSVSIDGHDLNGVSLFSLRNQIGVVTQETVVFHDTIAANIAYGNAGVARDEIVTAAKQAFADGFINRKPGGYDSVVGEQGATLSGGERQRLAIARAILRNPNILILDEATSMIDADSEAKIADALDHFCENRTALVIAHRLSTVIHADRIVVMQDGSIVDVGTHTDLLGRCTLYQQLCKTQLVKH